MQVYYVVKVIQHQNESINAVLQYLTAAGVPYVKLCPNFMTVQKQGTTLGIKTIKTLMYAKLLLKSSQNTRSGVTCCDH